MYVIRLNENSTVVVSDVASFESNSLYKPRHPREILSFYVDIVWLSKLILSVLKIIYEHIYSLNNEPVDQVVSVA